MSFGRIWSSSSLRCVNIAHLEKVHSVTNADLLKTTAVYKSAIRNQTDYKNKWDKKTDNKSDKTKQLQLQSLHVSKTLDDLFHNVKDPANKGVQWKRFVKLNEHLKGHRPGELTVVTGPTGSGKTTFVSEYSLDLCMQGVATLWGSFEIKYHTLEQKMLTQFLGTSIENYNRNEFDKATSKFGQLPLYFLNSHGQTDIKLVLEAAREAVLCNNVQHLVIDNLQFMLGLSAGGAKDRFYNQDIVIGQIREFATKQNCHVTLVAHPRKEKDDCLSNDSLYGGVKASQEADNIMIVVEKFHPKFKCQKYVQITKNRARGELGVVPLYYDKTSLCYSNYHKREAKLREVPMVDQSPHDETPLKVKPYLSEIDNTEIDYDKFKKFEKPAKKVDKHVIAQ